MGGGKREFFNIYFTTKKIITIFVPKQYNIFIY